MNQHTNKGGCCELCFSEDYWKNGDDVCSNTACKCHTEKGWRERFEAKFSWLKGVAHPGPNSSFDDIADFFETVITEIEEAATIDAVDSFTNGQKQAYREMEKIVEGMRDQWKDDDGGNGRTGWNAAISAILDKLTNDKA